MEFKKRLQRTMRRWVSLASVATLAACGGGGDPAPVFQTMAKTVENIQCQPIVNTVATVDASLASAGVVPRAAYCALDGLTRPAACGAPTGFLRVVEISSDQVALVRTLGFKAPKEFPAVTPLSSCPS